MYYANITFPKNTYWNNFWTNTADKVSVLHCHGTLELRAGHWGCSESSQCISSLASGALKRWAGLGGGGGRHTRETDCQRRNKKEAEMMKKLSQAPCLLVYLPAVEPGCAESERTESVNSCKHTAVSVHYISLYRQDLVLFSSSVFRLFPDRRLGWVGLFESITKKNLHLVFKSFLPFFSEINFVLNYQELKYP